MRYFILLGIVSLSVAQTAAQDKWVQEGAFRRYSGSFDITSPTFGCADATGNAIVEQASALTEVAVIDGIATSHSKPADGSWKFLPRSPHCLISVERNTDATTTTLKFNDAWLGSVAKTVEAQISTKGLEVDIYDSWISDDRTVGCVVFAPTNSTPTELTEYVVIVFKGEEVTFTLRVKPKNDVDIYVRPEDDYGVLVYLRGNGFTFPPSEEEVFTNGSYLVYQPSGQMNRINMPTRGPGSGRGRKIIWHSNKWDRLLLVDEFASGSLLVKASNGIVVDSIVSSSLDPDKPLRILSASGDNRQKWMATHMRVGDKNAITLWGMPESKEITSELFGTTDIATKQMPLSPWAIIIPFVSSSGGANALYAWDSQDVISVDEADTEPVVVNPLPAYDYVELGCEGIEGEVQIAVASANGESVLEKSFIAHDGAVRIDISTLPTGVYACRMRSSGIFYTTRFIKQ